MDMLQQEISEVKAELKEMNGTLIRNTTALEIHIARTELAEKRLDHVETFNRWWLGIMISAILAIALRLLLR